MTLKPWPPSSLSLLLLLVFLDLSTPWTTALPAVDTTPIIAAHNHHHPGVKLVVQSEFTSIWNPVTLEPELAHHGVLSLVWQDVSLASGHHEPGKSDQLESHSWIGLPDKLFTLRILPPASRASPPPPPANTTLYVMDAVEGMQQHTLSPGQQMEWRANDQGRFHLFLPLSPLPSSLIPSPEFQIRVAEMPKNHWLSFHLDHGLFHRMANEKVLEQFLSSSSPSSSNATSPGFASKAIRTLLHYIQSAIPARGSKHQHSPAPVVDDVQGKHHHPHHWTLFPPHSSAQEIKPGSYNPESNQVSAYLMFEEDGNGERSLMNSAFRTLLTRVGDDDGLYDGEEVITIIQEGNALPFTMMMDSMAFGHSHDDLPSTRRRQHKRDLFHRVKTPLPRNLTFSTPTAEAFSANVDSRIVGLSTSNNSLILIKAPAEGIPGQSPDLESHHITTVHDAILAITHLFYSAGASMSNFLHSVSAKMHWEEVSLTHNFLMRYFETITAAQSSSILYWADELEVQSRNMSFIEKPFETLLQHFGVKDTMTPESVLRSTSKHSSSSSSPFFTQGKGFGPDEVLSTLPSLANRGGGFLDARSGLGHDMFLGNMSMITQHFHTSNDQWNHFLEISGLFLTSLGGVVSEDILRDMHGRILSFQHGTGFIRQSMAHLVEFFHTLITLVKDVMVDVVRVTMGYCGMAMQVLLAILNIPIHVPWLSRFIVRHMNPMYPDHPLTVVSMIMYFVSTPATWTYMAMKGESPFTRADIQVLTSVNDFHLLLTTWNSHPLTGTTDRPILGKRNGIWDWIPRYAGTMFTTIGVVSTLIPIHLRPAFVDFRSMKLNRGAFVPFRIPFDIMSTVGTYLVTLWLYPMSQLEVPSTASAIIKDGEHPYAPTAFWWMGYAMFILTKPAKVFLNDPDGKYQYYAWISGLTGGVTQAIGASLTLADMIKATDFTADVHRDVVVGVCAAAWFSDTLTFLPDGISSIYDKLSVENLYVMLGLYNFRVNYMMMFNVVGLFPPPPGSPLPVYSKHKGGKH